MIALYVILALLALLMIVLIVRTLGFKPAPEAPVEIKEEAFDKEKAIRDLQALIRCKTVS